MKEGEMLILSNVSKAYGSSKNKVNALNKISLKINKGEFVIILGRSGSGKSTLISLIGGLEKPDRGDIFLNQINMTSLNQNQLAEIRRDGIAYIFQHFQLLNNFTVLENVMIPILIAKKDYEEYLKRAEIILKFLGLLGKQYDFPSELSGGQKQKVGIARALISKSDLILADEPTGDLDSKNSSMIFDFLYDLNKELDKIDEKVNWKPTIIVVTHDIKLIKRGMRIILLADGKIASDLVYDGDMSNLKQLYEI